MSFTFGWKPFVMNPTLNLKRKVLLEFMFTERFVGVVNNSVHVTHSQVCSGKWPAHMWRWDGPGVGRNHRRFISVQCSIRWYHIGYQEYISNLNDDLKVYFGRHHPDEQTCNQYLKTLMTHFKRSYNKTNPQDEYIFLAGHQLR